MFLQTTPTRQHWAATSLQDSQMSRIPFHSEDEHSFTTSSPTLEIALTARNEVMLVPIGWQPAGREADAQCEERAAASWGVVVTLGPG
jgi:hypothetical protein